MSIKTILLHCFILFHQYNNSDTFTQLSSVFLFHIMNIPYMNLNRLLLFLIVSIVPFLTIAKSGEIHFRQISPQGGFTHNAILSINQDKSGNMWFGSSQGLIRYNSNGAQWFVHLPDDSLSLPDSKINSICVDDKNNVWIATARGLCRFNVNTNKFNKINYTYEDNSAPQTIVSELIATNNNKFFIIDSKNFGILDLDSGKCTRIGQNSIESPRTIYVITSYSIHYTKLYE